MSPQFLLFAQHGWADTSRAIASLAHTIVPPETPVIAPDLGWLRTWLRIEPLIQQVEAAATKALEDYPDHAWRIMGHSMGGLIWIELLHRHPEWQFRVHSLALVGAPVGGSDLGRIIDPLGLGIAIARDLGVNRRPLAEAIAAQVPTVVIAGDSDGGSDGTVTIQCTKVSRASFVKLPDLSHPKLKDHPLVGEAVQNFWQQPKILPPEPDTPTRQLIGQLQQVPGMTDAHYRDIARSRVVLTLSDGTTLRTWKNGFGVLHVFVVDADDDCQHSGFVGWRHTATLEQVITDLITHSSN